MMPGTNMPRYPGQLGGPAESAFLAQGCLGRTLAMHACLDSGAALVCVVFEKAPLPVDVKDRSYAVNHIQVARQLVLPRR
jgi:predicted amidohydrolase YtcJ